MSRPFFRFLILIFLPVLPGCFLTGHQLPDWMAERPTAAGYLYGVGLSGETEDPGRERDQAIERAMCEIWCQVYGVCDCEFEIKKEWDNGTITMAAMRDNRTIRTITGVQVLKEFIDEDFFELFTPQRFRQETFFVLLRVPAGALGG